MAVTTTETLPVAIIGAGVAGLALAVMLRRQGLGVCLFEALRQRSKAAV